MKSLALFLLVSCFLFGEDSLPSHEIALFKIQRKSQPSAPEESSSSFKRCDGANDCSAKADFLWWQAAEAGLPYTVLTNSSSFNEVLIPVDYSWEPGVRLGFDWKTPYADWDLFSTWVWYFNRSQSQSSTSFFENGDFLLNLWIALESLIGCQSAEARWVLHYNVLDLGIGHSFRLDRGLLLRPFVGWRGGWIQRNWKFTYDRFLDSDLDVIFPAPGSAEEQIVIKQWGIGPRLGLEGSWLLPYGFDLFINGSFCLFYGEGKGVSTFNQTAVGGPSEGTLQLKSWRFLTNLEVICGLGWATCLRSDRMFLDLKLGWEISEWFDQIPTSDLQLSLYQLSQTATTLSLQGLTFSSALRF